MIDLQNAPAGVKKRLLELPGSPFVERAQYFYYKTASGQLVQIDICGNMQVSHTRNDLTEMCANVFPASVHTRQCGEIERLAS